MRLNHYVPLAKLHNDTNAIEVSVDYWKGRGLVLHMHRVKMGPKESGPFGRSVSFMMFQDDTERVTLEVMNRDNKKKVQAVYDTIVGQIKAKSGQGHDLLKVYADKYGLVLHDDPTAEFLPAGS